MSQRDRRRATDRRNPVGQAVPKPLRRHVRRRGEVEGRSAQHRLIMVDERGGQDEPRIGGGVKRGRLKRDRQAR